MSFIGKSVPAQDWEDRTSGRTLYASDLHPEGMLFGMILRSPYPYARIEGIDTSAALRIPGVCAVVTSKDLPPNTRYFHEGAADRPPLAEDLVRFVGQEVLNLLRRRRKPSHIECCSTNQRGLVSHWIWLKTVLRKSRHNKRIDG